MKTYIHYGTIKTKPHHKSNGDGIGELCVSLVEVPAKFDKTLFNPIRNDNFVKPIGGYWASPVDADWSWKDWCESEQYRVCDEKNSFKFTLKEDARVLHIKHHSELDTLPRNKL